MEQWQLVDADLFDVGVDVRDERLMGARSWHWLSARILGLLATPVAGYASIPIDETHERTVPIYRTRVQQHFLAAKEG